MKVKYINATGKQRKELVKVIETITGAKSEYKGMPTAAYQIDFFTVTRDSELEFSDMSDTEIVEKVLDGIAAAGFECEAHDLPKEEKVEETEAIEATEEVEAAETEEVTEAAATEANPQSIGDLVVSVPADKVNMENLNKLLAAKGDLIKKALGINEMPIVIEGDNVTFPWFKEVKSIDEVTSYSLFVSELCKSSLNLKRVTAKAKKVENEKYAFRCFLLRLGFIGKGFKNTRKVLLKNLTGSSAFKNGIRNAKPVSD